VERVVSLRAPTITRRRRRAFAATGLDEGAVAVAPFAVLVQPSVKLSVLIVLECMDELGTPLGGVDHNVGFLGVEPGLSVCARVPEQMLLEKKYGF
jgi:hypothetical protein